MTVNPGARAPALDQAPTLPGCRQSRCLAAILCGRDGRERHYRLAWPRSGRRCG